MIDIREALDAAAEAGDETLTDMAISRAFRALPTERRVKAIRNSIKRFCEALPPETTLAEVLENIDNLEDIDE